MRDALNIVVMLTPWLSFLCWSDWKDRRLPNLWTMGLAVMSLAIRLVLGGMGACLDGLFGGLVASAFLLFPFLLRGAGGGDVKMLGAVGCALGFQRVPLLLFATSVAGFLLGLAMLLTRKVDGARLKHYFLCLFWWNYDRKAGRASLPDKALETVRVPFGIAIAMGTWFALLFEILSVGKTP